MAYVHYEIPDELHRRAKSAAALKGLTLKDFLIDALETATSAAQTEQRPKGKGGGRA
jgi:hypothetical protein